jgi:hypothetical protein
MLRFFEFEVLLQKIDTALRRGMGAPRNTRPFRTAKIRQNGSSGRPRSTGAALAGVYVPQECSSGRLRSAGVL